VKLPAYFIVGAVPVKAVETEDGGMDVLAYDPDAREFRRAMQYLTAVSLPGGHRDVDRVTEAAFLEWIERLHRDDGSPQRRGP
jgi:hypothetical protein